MPPERTGLRLALLLLGFAAWKQVTIDTALQLLEAWRETRIWVSTLLLRAMVAWCSSVRLSPAARTRQDTDHRRKSRDRVHRFVHGALQASEQATVQMVFRTWRNVVQRQFSLASLWTVDSGRLQCRQETLFWRFARRAELAMLSTSSTFLVWKMSTAQQVRHSLQQRFDRARGRWIECAWASATRQALRRALDIVRMALLFWRVTCRGGVVRGACSRLQADMPCRAAVSPRMAAIAAVEFLPQPSASSVASAAQQAKAWVSVARAHQVLQAWHRHCLQVLCQREVQSVEEQRNAILRELALLEDDRNRRSHSTLATFERSMSAALMARALECEPYGIRALTGSP